MDLYSSSEIPHENMMFTTFLISEALFMLTSLYGAILCFYFIFSRLHLKTSLQLPRLFWRMPQHCFVDKEISPDFKLIWR